MIVFLMTKAAIKPTASKKTPEMTGAETSKGEVCTENSVQEVFTQPSLSAKTKDELYRLGVVTRRRSSLAVLATKGFVQAR
jgi:hypothetical protein